MRRFKPENVSSITIPESDPPHVYSGLAPSPDPGSDLLYAAHGTGVDAIATASSPPAVTVDALLYPAASESEGATAMTSGTTASGVHRVYVTSAGRLLAYEPSAGNTPDREAAIPGGAAVAVHLSLDGRFVLVTRHPAETATAMAVFDADTLDFIRDSSMAGCVSGPCPFSPFNPMALTIDGSHAFVSNPEDNLLDYVYIQPAHLVVTASALKDVIAAVPPEYWEAPGARQALLQETGTVQTLLANAEKVPPGPAQEALLRNADAKLSQMMTKYDGCRGGKAQDDVVSDCAEQASLMFVSSELQTGIESQLPLEPPKP